MISDQVYQIEQENRELEVQNDELNYELEQALSHSDRLKDELELKKEKISDLETLIEEQKAKLREYETWERKLNDFKSEWEIRKRKYRDLDNAIRNQNNLTELVKKKELEIEHLKHQVAKRETTINNFLDQVVNTKATKATKTTTKILYPVTLLNKPFLIELNGK